MENNKEKVRITFNIHYRCNYGSSVYVVIKSPIENRWDLQSAVQLEWHEGDFWWKEVEISPMKSSVYFNYKYVIAPSFYPDQGPAIWEEGLNRCFRADLRNKREFYLEDRWGHQKLKICLQNVFGSDLFERRALGILSQQLNIREKCTELEFVSCHNAPSYWISSTYWVPLKIENIDISVYFINKKKKTPIKNRRIDYKYLLDPEKIVKNLQKGIRVQENGINIVERPEYRHFMFSEINARLVLGSCINESSEKQLLSGESIGAIMSLETSKDQERRNHSSKAPAPENNNNIPTYNFPIEDSPFDLIKKAAKGARFLKELIETHKRVYVHCTYGVFRSVHVAIAYLHLYEGVELFKAIDMVLKVRSHAKIFKEICTKMFQNGKSNVQKGYSCDFQSYFIKKTFDLKFRTI